MIAETYPSMPWFRAIAKGGGMLALGVGIFLILKVLLAVPALIALGREEVQIGHFALALLPSIYDAMRGVFLVAAGTLFLLHSRWWEPTAGERH